MKRSRSMYSTIYGLVSEQQENLRLRELCESLRGGHFSHLGRSFGIAAAYCRLVTLTASVCNKMDHQ
jgi:hypothetical protein